MTTKINFNFNKREREREKKSSHKFWWNSIFSWSKICDYVLHCMYTKCMKEFSVVLEFNASLSSAWAAPPAVTENVCTKAYNNYHVYGWYFNDKPLLDPSTHDDADEYNLIFFGEYVECFVLWFSANVCNIWVMFELQDDTE